MMFTMPIEYATRLAVFSHTCSPSTGPLPPSQSLQQKVPEACPVLVNLKKLDVSLAN
jgi:hypothetical protein